MKIIIGMIFLALASSVFAAECSLENISACKTEAECNSVVDSQKLQLLSFQDGKCISKNSTQKDNLTDCTQVNGGSLNKGDDATSPGKSGGTGKTTNQ